MRLIFVLLTLFLCACSKQASNPDHLPDDYVLIEFAASLEDEYDKLYPSETKTIEPPTAQSKN